MDSWIAKMSKAVSLPKIKANELLTSLGVVDPNDLSNLEEICHSQGIDLKYENLKSSEGRLLFGKEKTTIFVKKNEQYPQRERFTIAHELGHYFLHKNILTDKSCDITDMFSWTDGKNIESEANEFAGEFLIPSQFLRPVAEGNPITYEQANEISKQFGASLTSSMLRHLEVTRYASAVIFYSNQKVLYYRRSNPMIDMGLFPIYGALSKYSEASKCQAYSEAPKSNVIFSESWFERNLDKYTIREQANFFPKINLGISIINLKLKA